MGIKSLFSWLLGLWGTGDAASTPRGHTGQREGQVPCRAAPQICGSAEQHEPDPELSLGVCAPMGTAMVSPVYRDALAQYGASPRVGSTVGAARAPSPPGRCREGIPAAARRQGSAALCTKISLLLPAPARSPAGSRLPRGAGPGTHSTAEQRRLPGGSSAAPCPVPPGAELRGCPCH